MKREDESISRIQSVTGVSRETLGRLSIYADLLRRWQCRLNLVGPGTLDSLWERHFLDSAQLARYIPTGSKIVDIGTGAGFPGLVLSIMGVGQVELVERDQQKCTFLREVIRATGAEANVHCSEAKNLRLDSVQVVTARACAPLVRLLKISKYFIGPTTYCVFPKERPTKRN